MNLYTGFTLYIFWHKVIFKQIFWGKALVQINIFDINFRIEYHSQLKLNFNY